MKAPLLTLLGAAATAVLGAPAPAASQNGQTIPGKYIIQLLPGATPESVAAHQNKVRSLVALRKRDLAGDVVGDIARTFHIGSFNAYSGSFDASTLAAVLDLGDVLSVVPDQVIELPPLFSESNTSVVQRDLTTQTNAVWGLGDVSHRDVGATEYVYDTTAGEGMTAYVVDSGIRVTHSEFEGRARFGINGFTGSTDGADPANTDTYGHGTHVAGIVAGRLYGVAKKAEVVDVKVFQGSSGSSSALLTGIDWAVRDITTRNAKATSVLNLSLGTPSGSALNAALLAAYNEGILSVVAAGNNDGPAADWYPANLPEALVVGMTQSNRRRTQIQVGIYGSNYGPSLDVFAPGRDIVSAGYQSDDQTATYTGTSMASPLVAGLVCYLRALEGGLVTPDEVVARVVELSTKDVVVDPNGSPNRLVYNGSGL